MTDIIALQLASLPVAQFSPSSRYYGIQTAKTTLPDGRVVVHILRRFVPPPDRFSTLEEHAVRQGERLDHIAARHLADPELFWRICDANRAMNPPELEEIGKRLRITLPEGISGV